MKIRAFTLIELAIVIVIIGLVVGGVLGSQSLIKSSKRNGVINQITQYKNSVRAFNLEFDSRLPGDFLEAADYNLDQDSSGNTNFCNFANGDGDGKLDSWTGDVQPNGIYRWELSNFWLHMLNAGILKEHLEDHSSSCLAVPLPGLNYPSAEIGDGIIAVTDDSAGGDLFYVLGGRPASYYIGSATIGHAFSWTNSQHLTPRDANFFDRKIDDGSFNTGNIKAINGYESSSGGNWITDLPTYSADGATSCVNSAVYNLSYESKVCVISIKH